MTEFAPSRRPAARPCAGDCALRPLPRTKECTATRGSERRRPGRSRLSDYRRLLVRLYGFHRPFEDVARSAVDVFRINLDMSVRARSPLLLADLQSIGFDPSAATTLPLWRPSIRLASKGSLLGALYVLEGSTLGGVQIARALKDRVGNDLEKALLFFVGRGERQGAMWRELLEELESSREDDEEAMKPKMPPSRLSKLSRIGWRGGELRLTLRRSLQREGG